MPRDAPAVVSDAPVVPERPETPEQCARLIERRGGRRVQPEKISGIGHASVGEVQGQWRQVSLEDLRRVARQQGRLLGGGPEAVAHTRRLSPCPPATLVGRG